MEALTTSWIDAIGLESRYTGGVYLSFYPPVSTPNALASRDLPVFANGVVDLLDRRSLDDSDLKWSASYQQVLDAALPRSVRVSVAEDDSRRFVQRFWTDDLGDEKALCSVQAAPAMAREDADHRKVAVISAVRRRARAAATRARGGRSAADDPRAAPRIHACSPR
ncbi:MAG: hypothetical protein WKG01_05315 [Kofleriaceae bacterium]